MNKAFVTLCLLYVGLIPQKSFAAFTKYQIAFVVEEGTIDHCVYQWGPETFACTQSDAAGKVYYGAFGVNDADLATDGEYLLGDMSHFVVKMEDTVWNVNAFITYGGIQRSYFRGPSESGNGHSFDLDSTSPGLDVVEGQVVNLRGDIHDEGDTGFVEFSFSPKLSCGSGPHYCSTGLFHVIGSIDTGDDGFPSGPVLPEFRIVNRATGSFQISAVPLPGTFWLLGTSAGFLIIHLGRQKRSRPA